MASVVRNITFGCPDAHALAQFRSVVTARPLTGHEFRVERRTAEKAATA